MPDYPGLSLGCCHLCVCLRTCSEKPGTSSRAGKHEVTHSVTAALEAPHRADRGQAAGTPVLPSVFPVLWAGRIQAGNSPLQGTALPLLHGAAALSAPTAGLQLPASLAPPPSSPSQTLLVEIKPVLEQNFLRACFEPAGRRAAEIDPRISRISSHDLVGFTLARGRSPHSQAALPPRGAVNLLFFPGGDVVSWECPQNTWWVSSSPASAIFSKPGRWPLLPPTPLHCSSVSGTMLLQMLPDIAACAVSLL